MPLVLALYGHPDAGGFWEEQCEKAVKVCGFEGFRDEGWRSVYWHPKEKALIVIYVDDFNLSAPVKSHSLLWADLRKRLNLEEPSDPNRFLGCYKRPFYATAKDLEKILQNKPELYPRVSEKTAPVQPRPLSTLKEYDPNTKVRGYIYDMEEYLTKRYRHLVAQKLLHQQISHR